VNFWAVRPIQYPCIRDTLVRSRKGEWMTSAIITLVGLE
jgi:hypothetical protein